jgi:hypothetical protein
MYFRIIDEIRFAETFVQGSSIRELPRLQKTYGRGR